MMEKFVTAILDVMRAEGITIAILKEKAPVGFWTKVAARTAQNGKKTAQGYFAQRKDKILAELGDRLATAGDTAASANVDRKEKLSPPEHTVNDEKVDVVSRAEVIRMLQEMENRLTELIEDRMNQAREERPQEMPNIDALDVPPPPPKNAPGKNGKVSGKKFAGSKEDLRARIDSELFKLLDAEAQTHFSGNMSRCLDTLLWRYYGRPKLSFETPTAEGR